MYNFKTQSTEYFDDLPPVDRLNEFLPDDPAAQMAFQCRLKLGHSPYVAWAMTLDACTPNAPALAPHIIARGL